MHLSLYCNLSLSKDKKMKKIKYAWHKDYQMNPDSFPALGPKLFQVNSLLGIFLGGNL